MAHWIDEMGLRTEYPSTRFGIFVRNTEIGPEYGGLDKLAVRMALFKDEASTLRYHDAILGIERRWDAVMKRRSEPKRLAWNIEIIADFPKN